MTDYSAHTSSGGPPAPAHEETQDEVGGLDETTKGASACFPFSDGPRAPDFSTDDVPSWFAAAIRSGALGGSYGPYPRPESLRLPSFASALSGSSTAANHSSSRSTTPSRYTSDSQGVTYSATPPECEDGNEVLSVPQLPYAQPGSASSTSSSVSSGMHLPTLRSGVSSPASAVHLVPAAPFQALPQLPRSSSASHLFPPISASHEHLLWTESNASPDDFLHDPSPGVDAAVDARRWKRHSLSRLADISTLLAVVLVLLGLFLAWPVLRFGVLGSWNNPHSGTRIDLGFNLGGINSSGSVPLIPGLPGLIDTDTPLEVYTRQGFFDGETYNLVFSDEARHPSLLVRLAPCKLIAPDSRSLTSTVAPSGPATTRELLVVPH